MAAGDSNSPVIDYTSLDHASLVRDLISYAQQIFPAELWTDFNSSDFAMHLLEMMGYATDLVAYQQNACILETVIDTLILEQNFRKAAKTFSYSMQSASPSTCATCRIYNLSASALDYPVTISSYDVISAPGDIPFRPYVTSVHAWPPSLLDPTDGYFVEVPIVQGEKKREVVGGPDGVLGVGNGLPGQKLQLGYSPMIDNTLSVTVAGVVHTLIENWVAAGPADKVYMLETTSSLATYVIFGDGVNGRPPQVGENIEAIYCVGGGDLNFPALTEMSTSNLLSEPAMVGASARMMVASTGGGNRQTLLEAKRELPTIIKTNDRAVTDEDYAALATLVNGVFKCTAKPGIPIGGATPVLLFVVPDPGTGNPSSALANQIITHIKPKRMSGKRVYVRNPSYVNLVVEADAYLTRNTQKYVGRQRVIDAISAKYTPAVMEFGSSFGLQSLYDDTGPVEIEGISRVYYKKFTVRPHYGRYVNKPTTGNGSVESIDVVWPSVQRREWGIEVVAPEPFLGVQCSQYEIRQRVLGTTTTLTDDVIQDDMAGFQTNEFVGWNVRPLPEELSSYYSWPVTANTDQSITVSGGPSGLLTYVQPDDYYVIEKLEAVKGKILRATLEVAASASTLVFVDSAISWAVNDTVLVTNTLGVETKNTVAQVVLPSERLIDGNAEAAGVLAWSVLDCLPTKDVAIFQAPGVQSLKVTFAGPGATPRVFQTSLVIGRRYTVAGYARGNGAAAIPLVVCGAVTLWTGSNAAAWQAIAPTTFIATATSIEFGFNGGAGVVWFDGLSVMEEPALVLGTAITALTGSTLDCMWESADGTVTFAVVNGTTAFVVGDGLYVDTYAAASDVILRKEDFPVLDALDISVNTIGGV
jgi:hypothetical protein